MSGAPSRSGRDRGIHVSGAAVYDEVSVAESHLTIVVEHADYPVLNGVALLS
jgi:hypothetical protein